LLENGAIIEAQSERTKDTALSLACSGGRQEVVEVLLKKGANREHRNVSDYTGKISIDIEQIFIGYFHSFESCCFWWICEYN
jgi:ankyrin repeat protein